MIAAEPLVERLAGIGDVTGGDHRAGDLRPADRASAPLSGRGQRLAEIHRHPELREASRDRLHAIDAMRR